MNKEIVFQASSETWDWQLGNPAGKVNKGWDGELLPLTDNPNEYPRALATGTATALPTWMYLYK